MTIGEYVEKINAKFRSGIGTEHSYRADLQNLLEDIATGVTVTNEPTRIECGAPDYIVTKKEIPIGYIEAKDIGTDLNSRSLKEQFDRYRAALDNLIITDYLNFHFYQNGELKTSIRIAEIEGKRIVPIHENFEHFETLIANFCLFIGQTIRSSRKLAEMMAAKAKLLADVIEKAINSDEETRENSSIKEQMTAFKEILIHDIDAKEFADIYAQTIAYGMFSARLHDPNLDTFSRQEAAELIPKTNPFLRKLFQYIAGYDLDQRLVWIVESLADIFRATDIKALLKNFGKATQTTDPIIHFYETFLSSYDARLRKARGVWYTPEPVVNFIVRAVDDILKSEFSLKDGLADTSKTKIKTKVFTKATSDQRSKIKEEFVETEVHKVQILDPATGTGTFLAEVVKQIYQKFEGQQGIWSNYVENHLIPRLNGFELLMASYAMAHLKLDLLMTETGFKPTKEQRFRIYLTNSLEEHHPDTGTLFANWLSTEANEANHIKRDTPVMVVLGNPPYSGESANKGDWIMNLMEDYKKEPGGKEKLKEQNSKFINDDYVKFIRYAQYFIEKNGSGIVAFINPHGYLDNPTFRGMRWNILKTFDKIYTIDLHGNAKKNEVSPDGEKDENVFDIMQGVSINLFINTGKQKNNELGKVFHFDLFGKRSDKYSFLDRNSVVSIPFRQVINTAPMYYMLQKDLTVEKEYSEGIALNNLFTEHSLGLLTKKDKFIIDFKKNNINSRLKDFVSNDLLDKDLAKKYALKIKDNDKWDLAKSRKEIQKTGIINDNYKILNYRCFDKRFIYYDANFVARLNTRVLGNLNQKNIALISTRQLAENHFHHIFLTDTISDQCFISNKTKEGCQVFPLYLYPEKTGLQTINQTSARTPNLNLEIINQIASSLSLSFTNEKEIPTEGEVCFVKSEEVRPQFRLTFAPIDILDYIYAVLHSPTYREKYKEFLKIDFPRVPYPKDTTTFWKLVEFGEELRQIHLLKSPIVEKYITQYPVDGNNLVEKIKYEGRKVFINESQYFDNVPEIAWEFYIGGYQPAQKWLKDRKGRELNFEDILHYQKIIVALAETNRLMKEIDKIEID